ncbi:hypothetical protein D0S48_18170 [Psychrobacillus sp. AK 1817]|uniref:MFS transporter n=1 Tax=Psychrobacillus sp. AK 1817 TaxID=2303505 RepID=UPI0012463E13|nr:MFS transporter [Psychrobacillus sp. AK 1817]QEY22427.1 hypothetical protein D0S48_18170 [Psychrobacillus sp. AK 1817]
MNKKLFAMTTIILLALIATVYWFTLKEETKLPSDNWSRTFSVDIPTSNYSNFQVLDKENSYILALRNFKQQTIVSCDLDLKCKEARSLALTSTSTNAWSDETDSYYIKNYSLLHFNTKNDIQEIAPNVEDFVKSDDTLVYWTKDRQLTVLKDGQEQAYGMDEPIYDVKIFDNNIFAITKDTQGDRFSVYTLTNEPNQLFKFTSTASLVSSLNIIEHSKEEYLLLMDATIVSGGAKSKVIQQASFNLSPNQTIQLTKLKFEHEEDGRTLDDITQPTVLQQDGQTLIAFTATYAGNKNQVFMGPLTNGTIQATLLSKSGIRYERPVILDKQTVAFLEMNGSQRELVYTSSDPIQIEESKQISKEDYKQAAYTQFSKSFNGLMLVLFAFAWIILAFGISYLSTVILNRFKYEKTYLLGFVIHVVSLLALQIFFLYRFTKVETIIANVPFITESWHFVGLLVVGAVISVVPLFLARYNPEEEDYTYMILYATFMNLAVLFFLVGPYIF